MNYSEELKQTVAKKLADLAYSELMHIKHLRPTTYKKGRRYARLHKYWHCVDCVNEINHLI